MRQVSTEPAIYGTMMPRTKTKTNGDSSVADMLCIAVATVCYCIEPYTLFTYAESERNAHYARRD